jgi:hypothetical protein
MGGLAPDRVRWIHARPRFFLPIPVLRNVFRGTLVAGLREAHGDGRLDFPGTLAPLKPDAAFRTFVRSLYRQAWVVYAKPPFGSPEPPRSWPCPRCGAPMRVIERLTPRQIYLASLLADILHDTS